MHDVLPQTLLILALAGFAAGFIDSIAGGGGLLSVPALLLAGLSPAEALGTNKAQSLFGSGSATLAYASKGHVDYRELKLSFALSAGGSACGALLATLVSADFLKAFLPILLIAIALYFAVKPDVSDLPGRERMRPALFAATIVPAIGFYDGILGPGTGSFFMLAYVALAGLGVLNATAQTKLLNFASNIGAFAVFALQRRHILEDRHRHGHRPVRRGKAWRRACHEERLAAHQAALGDRVHCALGQAAFHLRKTELYTRR